MQPCPFSYMSFAAECIVVTEPKMYTICPFIQKESAMHFNLKGSLESPHSFNTLPGCTPGLLSQNVRGGSEPGVSNSLNFPGDLNVQPRFGTIAIEVREEMEMHFFKNLFLCWRWSFLNIKTTMQLWKG